MAKQSGQIRALEFFSGIGLARAGMSAAGIKTVWANDIDEVKRRLYAAQWGEDDLAFGDVFDVDADTVPEADVAWASSPCTDLSLAGKRGGLADGPESRVFSDLLMLSSTWEIALPVQWFLKTSADFHHLTKAVIFALLLWSSIDLDIQLTHLN